MIFIDGFIIDAAPREDHSYRASPTQHPLESGSVITDHVTRKPIRVNIEGVVSDAPLAEDVVDPGVLRSEEALSFLLDLRNNPRPVTVETSLGVFDDMVLGNLDVPRDARTGAALKFRAAFIQIEVVENQRSFVPVEIPGGNRRVNRGNRPSPEPSGDEETPEASEKTKENAGRSIWHRISR